MTLVIRPPGDISHADDSDSVAAYPVIAQGTGAPAANLPVGSLYLRSDGGAGTSIYVKEATGTTWATISGGAGTTIATDTIWDAAGDLVQGTGANTAARLAIGAANTVLTTNGTTAAWSAVSSAMITSLVATKVTGTYPPISFATGSGNGITLGTSPFYEAEALRLETTAELRVRSAGTAVVAFSSVVASEPQYRLAVYSEGYIRWGSGSAGGDTNLYRNGVGILKLESHLEFNEAGSIIAGTTTGLKIATGATQKLGFWNVTPVVQPAAYTQTYATATRTNTTPVGLVLTSNGASANQVLVDVATTGVADPAKVNANFDDVAAQLNNLITDVANNKQLINSLIDDHQAIGLAAP